MKLSQFGKTIRKLRMDHCLLLGNMAKKLNISSSYLSSIEVGQRAIPKDFLSKIKNLNIFNKKELEEIEWSINETLDKFSFEPKNHHQKLLLTSLAKNLDNLTESQIKVITTLVVSHN